MKPISEYFNDFFEYIKKHKYKIGAGLVLIYFSFPLYNRRPWIYYYIKGKCVYEKSNKISSTNMLKLLNVEFNELMQAKTIYQISNEFSDCFHVILLYITTLIPIPGFKYILPTLARQAAVKCAFRYYSNGCIRSLNNCQKHNHYCG